jgi:hypothetical protein
VVEVRQRLAAIAATLATATPSPTGPVTVRAGFVPLPRSRPPEMPSVPPEMPSVPPEIPPELPEIRPTIPARPQMLELSPETPALSPETPTLPPELPRSDAPETDDITVPRRSRWPMAVIAVGMLAAGVTLVVAVRRQGATSPPASPPPRLAGPPPPALATPTPVAAAEVTPRVPASATAEVTPPKRATAEVTPPAPATTELVVEPRLARLAVDGHPVPLVDGRARLTLSPGDHLATATLGVRSTRRRFTVTAEHPAKLSLQVPVADQHVVPPASPTPPTAGDVDAVQDPFHR